MSKFMEGGHAGVSVEVVPDARILPDEEEEELGTTASAGATYELRGYEVKGGLAADDVEGCDSSRAVLDMAYISTSHSYESVAAPVTVSSRCTVRQVAWIEDDRDSARASNAASSAMPDDSDVLGDVDALQRWRHRGRARMLERGST